MSLTTHLSDRMPSVAAGLARWSPPEEEHLTACPECRTEWALVKETAALGSDLEGTLDLEALQGRVLAGLRSPVRKPVRPLTWLIPLAAAAAVAVAVLRGSGSPPDGSDPPALLPELEMLSSSDLESILTLFPAAAPRSADGFEDLTEAELSSVLKDLEG